MSRYYQFVARQSIYQGDDVLTLVQVLRVGTNWERMGPELYIFAAELPAGFTPVLGSVYRMGLTPV